MLTGKLVKKNIWKKGSLRRLGHLEIDHFEKESLRKIT